MNQKSRLAIGTTICELRIEGSLEDENEVFQFDLLPEIRLRRDIRDNSTLVNFTNILQTAFSQISFRQILQTQTQTY